MKPFIPAFQVNKRIENSEDSKDNMLHLEKRVVAYFTDEG